VTRGLGDLQVKSKEDSMKNMSDNYNYIYKYKYNNEMAKVRRNPHGTRTCIKRKNIHYGKFFDFCAEKCVYN